MKQRGDQPQKNEGGGVEFEGFFNDLGGCGRVYERINGRVADKRQEGDDETLRKIRDLDQSGQKVEQERQSHHTVQDDDQVVPFANIGFLENDPQESGGIQAVPDMFMEIQDFIHRKVSKRESYDEEEDFPALVFGGSDEEGRIAQQAGEGQQGDGQDRYGAFFQVEMEAEFCVDRVTVH